MRAAALLIIPALAAAPALGQQTISPVNRFSWSENCGWMDWAAAGAQAARISGTFLSGSIWCENIGWVSVGNGNPGVGDSYANASGSDFGVNLDPGTHLLSGMAWGENVGWINFSAGAAAVPANPARIDPQAARLRGYAWGENVGWINLDDAAHFVGLGAVCYANCDSSTIAPVLNVNDFLCFINKFTAGDPYANCDNSTAPPALNVLDFACFLNKFAAGCP